MRRSKTVEAATGAVAEVGGHVGRKALSRAWPFLEVLALACLLLPVGLGLHLTLGVVWWGVILLAVLAPAHVTWAFITCSQTSKTQRTAVTVTWVVVDGWLLTASILGLTGTIRRAWVAVLVVVVLVWFTKMGTRNTGSGAHGAAAFFERVGLKGARMVSHEDKGYQLRAVIEAGAGKTGEDVRAAVPAIAAGLHKGASQVRGAVDPADHSRAVITVTQRDLLKVPPRWPMSLEHVYYGGDMTDPLVLGRYEDGTPMVLHLAGDPRAGRNTAHLMIAGTAGSGKGGAARVLLGGAAPRRRSTIWAVDIMKPGQNIGPAAGIFDWFAVNKQQAAAMYGALPAVITARTNWLADHGLDAWTPDCGLNHLIIWTEEAASILRDFDSMVDPLAAMRSAGMTKVVSLQRPSFDNFPTSMRANINTRLVFGVAGDQEERIVMTDDALEAGAHPAQWGTSHPGMCYLTGAPGVDQSRDAVPGRTCFEPFAHPLTGADAMRTWVSHCLQYRDPIDQVTREAAGQAWVNRVSNFGSGSGPVKQLLPAGPGVPLAAAMAAGPVRESITVRSVPAPAPLEPADDEDEGEEPRTAAEADALVQALREQMPADMLAFIDAALAGDDDLVDEEDDEDPELAGMGPVTVDTEEMDEAERLLRAEDERDPGPAGRPGDSLGNLVSLAALAAGRPQMTGEAARVYVLSRMREQVDGGHSVEFTTSEINALALQTGSPTAGGKMIAEFHQAGSLSKVRQGVHRLEDVGQPDARQLVGAGA
jgi:hypothetical protein